MVQEFSQGSSYTPGDDTDRALLTGMPDAALSDVIDGLLDNVPDPYLHAVLTECAMRLAAYGEGAEDALESKVTAARVEEDYLATMNEELERAESLAMVNVGPVPAGVICETDNSGRQICRLPAKKKRKA